jgi:hypothetical protein
MTDSRVALGMDRLPWLPDEPVRPGAARKASSHGVLAWVVAGVLLVAAGSYWLGTRNAGGDQATQPQARPGTTLTLPDPRPVQPEVVAPVTSPEVPRVAEPEVRRVVERSGKPAWKPLPRTVPSEVAERVERTMATEEMDKVAGAQGVTAKAQPPKPLLPPVANTQNVKLWPARESAGATGRVVQIGAFGTRLQAKLGWKHMARAYPGVRRLPAVVVETRNSRGRRFYRFQIGTTSQAHSEVLCQRMERIRFSCAVVGLPGARKAVER